MPAVLTTQSNVTCGHSPGRVSTSSPLKLRVGTAAVLVKAGVQGKSVGLCSTVTDPNSGAKQCTSVTSVTAGEANKLTAGGQKVVTAALAGGTDGTVGGTPQLLLSATPAQSKLTAA